MACESSVRLPYLLLRPQLTFQIRLILLSAILLSAAHPGFYAGALQVSEAHNYELKTPVVADDRSETYDIELRGSQIV